MSEVLIQVSPASRAEGGQDLAPRVPEKFQNRAAEITAAITDITKELSPQVAELLKVDGSSPWSIDELQLTFGISAQAGSNIVIVNVRGQATFTVSVKWSCKD
jgi:hypothetical protein